MPGRELPDFNTEANLIVDVAIWPQLTRRASLFHADSMLLIPQP
jgi:hypothetical protein